MTMARSLAPLRMYAAAVTSAYMNPAHAASTSSAGVAKAYQIGPSAVVGAFDYSYLLFAMFWGFALFNEVPDATVVLGMCLIAASGVWVLRS